MKLTPNEWAIVLFSLATAKGLTTKPELIAEFDGVMAKVTTAITEQVVAEAVDKAIADITA